MTWLTQNLGFFGAQLLDYAYDNSFNLYNILVITLWRYLNSHLFECSHEQDVATEGRVREVTNKLF